MYSGLSASLTMLATFRGCSPNYLISPISQKIIDLDSTIPKVINILFVLSIFALQMIDVWKKKN